jgi:phospholipase C
VVTNPGAGAADLSGIWSWETMPERLQQAGVSWKIYNQLATNNNVLSLFKAYTKESSPLFRNALLPLFPGDFEADVAAGTLPKVSWVLSPTYLDEHPPAPPELGQWVTAHVLSALVSNPEVWARTVLFVTYDENGGFFDHVPPPTPPPGTPGEYLTTKPLPAASAGIAGPIGLGFRVPALVVSPFSRGGLLCSETFDHTSLLRFLETRFRVEAPNLSAWRRATVGDLTSTLNLASRRDPSVPALPQPSPVDPKTLSECAPSVVQGQVAGNLFPIPVIGEPPAYPVPTHQQMPGQEHGPPRHRPSGPHR